jgi:hypothetical protein
MSWRKGQNVIAQGADTQVCPYDRHVMLQNPPSGVTALGALQATPLQFNNSLIINILLYLTSGYIYEFERFCSNNLLKK